MSQSNAHINLVFQIVNELKSRYPEIFLIVDIQENPGDPIPPVINGFRPDVYAPLTPKFPATIIAEAKTDSDLENKHTYEQIMAFINHVESKKNGDFILSVSGCAADQARGLVRILFRYLPIKHARLFVFDGLDLWHLDKISGETWDLF